jgi:CheY-like chemotaxis protein
VGTSFEVFLPVVDAPATSTTQGVPSEPGPRGAETVLVVEDQAGVLRLILNILRGRGYTVLEAGHGNEAIEVSDRHAGPIHLLLTDLVMPHMSGSEVADAILLRRPGIKALFMSGYTADAVVRQGILASETSFLQKPFTTAGLARKVREALDGCPS